MTVSAAFLAGMLVGAVLATFVCALLWYGRTAVADPATREEADRG